MEEIANMKTALETFGLKELNDYLNDAYSRLDNDDNDYHMILAKAVGSVKNITQVEKKLQSLGGLFDIARSPCMIELPIEEILLGIPYNQLTDEEKILLDEYIDAVKNDSGKTVGFIRKHNGTYPKYTEG